ncbi:MAG: GHKL domain-containing protein [Lachnospiraceae bacterium]|nr:GHKL domain-containing protein [Lachnospiraceae bacterium]
MSKIQKMYEEDNRQMSQKLHRSKEILPMIANYVSSMDGTQDEEMRKKLEAVCHDYGKELGGAEMSAEFFETTGIDLADLLLRTKIIECGEQDIELNVFVSTQINEDMKRLDISDGEITRLLGDLLRNAINAVSKLQDKMILLLIARNENDCVLIRIYDSGIPFPPYILEHFGERGYTTWGTGNGLADLMDTVTRVHGSIEINMDMDPGDVFTKEIYICFDGKNTINIVKKENTQREIDANVCMET